MAGQRIRILLVDDHALLRAGLAALLNAEPDLEVAGDAATGEEALELARRLEPDVVVMDLSLPGRGGLDATRRLTELGLGTRVLVLTMHAEEEFLMAAVEAGASGYLTKQSADDELVAAIRVVAGGEAVLNPTGARIVMQSLQSGWSPGSTRSPAKLLSSREREILALTAAGYSASEIGERLGISAKTVDTYRQRVTRKLGFGHRSDLVHFAVREGLLTTAD